MTLQSKLLTCRCLNVQLIHDQREQPSIEKTFELLGRNQNSDQDLDQFLINSNLIQIIPAGIKINYEYLCLKRVIEDNLQIVFCTVCELETHAIFISKTSSSSSSSHMMVDSSKGSIAFANSSLLSDEKAILELKSSKNFSPALGIIVPDRLMTNLNNEMKQHNTGDSGIARTDSDNSYFLVSNYIQADVADKIKMFLKQEKLHMNERIKRFSSEQEKQFKQIYQKTLNNKQSFLRMIEAIKIRHNIDNNNDEDNKDNKENRNDAAVRQHRRLTDSFVMDKNSIQFDNRSQKISASDLPSSLSTVHTAVKNSDEFDSIFDIDDLDANQFGGSSMESYGRVVRQRDNSDDNDDDQVERRDNVFPLKESHQYSSVLNNQTYNIMNDESYSSSASGNVVVGLPISSSDHRNLQRKISSSLVSHNINHHAQQQNFYHDDHDDYSSQRQHYHPSTQIANSLPIQIPQFGGRRNDREMEESFRINPGESMADSIKKMARSVRNEIYILDDRPRRRLNTGDLIKSRPFYN
ncbi:hypothetical protein DERF_000893 [Dermatophagoides farinae]|uniref:Uncharacterized protein n=1 Tax=Dermatophagoides farinae TaxID=6954 RepID=A0A922I9H0_DERFA|nr:hypothetical protein DERF_000893 [Dermatophagoides farinae]